MNVWQETLDKFAAEEARARRAATRACLLEAGAPEIHLRHVYDREPEPGEALGAVRRFLAEDTTFLVLVGGVGCRKSGAATWAMTRTAGSRFIKAACVAALSGFEAEARRQFRELEGCRLLVVDELRVDVSAFAMSVLDRLLDARYDSLRKTIITANVEPGALTTALGERLTDRIREVGRLVVVGGASQRQKHTPQPLKVTE